jgi:Domain of unknown function (DUF1877)
VSLGVFFALDDAQHSAIWDAYEAEDDAMVIDILEQIESAWDEAHLQQVDKAWDAIHRVLSDGTLDSRAGQWPLKAVVLGGECVYFGDDYMVRLVDVDDIKEIAPALAAVTQPWFRERFDKLRDHGYVGAADDEDFEYTWTWFEELRAFYAKIAQQQRAILFTVD